ncbi:MAG TPA: dethiobiotin synthase [Casimicrobiaceae bacterium]|nr:dethiobiotin synthase [Casimicrobiaceae bacterium]
MTTGVFITATDTGVGKTWFAAALLRMLVAKGRRAVGMKPVMSGADEPRNDVELLREAGNVRVAESIVNPYAFAPAIAPHVAARSAGVAIELDRIEAAYRALCEAAEVVVVEGAGGALVPLNARDDMLDIAMRLRLPVVLVVGVRLGCINHALLSAVAIRSRGLVLAGWVANRVDPAMAESDATLATLDAALPAPRLATLSRGQADLPPLSVAWCATGLL